MPEKPIPRDLAFFLQRTVFPGIEPRLIEEALSCAKILYLAAGGEKKLHGLLVVYAGSIRVGGMEYARGDYVLAEGTVVGVKDSIIIYFPGECGRILETGLYESETCVVDDLVHRPPVCVEPGTSCLEAVKIMFKHGVSSVLVCKNGEAIAIFTDTDLRRVAASRGCVPEDTPVEECGTKNPLGVETGTTCVEAATTMMERYVKHLIVREAGRVRGVITVRDVAYAEALGPLYARRLIDAATTAEALADAYRRVVRFLRRSLSRLRPASSPQKAEHYARMASLALWAVVERAAWIAARETHLERGMAYLAAGSMARQEQPLPTDRDTLLLYNESLVAEEDARLFAERVEELLDAIGFPGCSHGYTARRLLYSLEDIQELVEKLAWDPATHVVTIGLLMDVVDVWPRDAGYGGLIRRLLAEKIARAGSGPSLRAAMAAYRPRLGVLGRLPRRLDIKRDLLAPIVYSVKALAAASGAWEEVNTARRLLALTSSGVLPGDLAEEALQAYQVALGYAGWSLAVHGRREIDTADLSGYERQLLRHALQAAAKLVDRARQAA